MQVITSRPEAERSSPESAVEVDSRPRLLSRADLVLFFAIVAPPMIIGLLVAIGVGVGAAVCIMFVLVFAVTTTMDVRWLQRRRRSQP
jgi:hypothetical protein